MAFDFGTIIKGAQQSARKIVIYGPPKMGKSTLASSGKDSFLIATEDRVTHIDCDKAPVVKSMQEVYDIFQALYTEKHPYKTIVIDTLDWLEPMLHAHVCQTKGFASITDDHNKETAFQKGLKYHAVEEWKKFLNACDSLREDKKLNIVLVAHSDMQKVTPPDNDSYDRYAMKIDKNAVSVVEEWADVIGFYNREVMVRKEDAGFGKKNGKAIGGDKRVIYLSSESPAWIAGNSYGLRDCEVSLDSIKDIMNYILTENNNNKTTTEVK